MTYCARANVYALGLPPEAFARAPRLVESASPAADTLSLRAHGFATDDPVTLAVQSSSILGATAAALPAPLLEGTVYYVRASGSDVLQLAAAPGGAAINLTSAGAGIFGILRDHGTDLDAAIVQATAIINEKLIAHSGTVTAEVLTGVCAWLAATIFTSTHSSANPFVRQAIAAALAPLREIYEPMLARWSAGAVVKGATDATPGTPENGAVLIELDGRGYHTSDEDARV